jgi:hypothetical protein
VDQEQLLKRLEQMDQRLISMEEEMKQILDAIAGRKPDKKPEPPSPFMKQKEVVQLLTRTMLEKCEEAGWLQAKVRRHKLVLYLRNEVMQCVWKISQGQYP